MPLPADQNESKAATVNQHAFRRAVLRGLGVVLPPLLTIVILVWVWNTVRNYVLIHVETGARYVLVMSIAQIHDGPPDGGASTDADGNIRESVTFDQKVFRRLESGEFIPVDIYENVRRNLGVEAMPETGVAAYQQFVENEYLKPWAVVTVSLCLFIVICYLLGKILAARVGRMFWNFIEQIIQRVPVIRNVYSSVKQVTDFVFSDQEIEYTRVVAVEYPRKGIWSVGFVTGEGMLDIRSAANEPLLSVLMPTSPMPVTGFTITVRKSETIDLDITIDQAIQFIVSCGVVVPPQQLQNATNGKYITAVADGDNGQPATETPASEKVAQ